MSLHTIDTPQPAVQTLSHPDVHVPVTMGISGHRATLYSDDRWKAREPSPARGHRAVALGPSSDILML